jgi:hypothetical protein
MASLTAIFGTVLLIELAMNCSNSNISVSTVERSAMNCSNSNISVSTVERSDFVKVAFSLGGPGCCRLEVRVGQAMFFCCSAWCLHQEYSASNSTLSKTGNYFLYYHLALSQPNFTPHTTPMPPDLH